MIAIAQEKLAAAPVAALSFLAATAEDPALRAGQYDAVLAFNYLHLVRDLPGTLRRTHCWPTAACSSPRRGAWAT